MKRFYLIFILFLLFSCAENSGSSGPENPERNLIILYTNDEHGWMESSSESDGAAALMGLWKSKECYTSEGPYIILSGGDNWTGPAISTWFKGESMVEVMNTMHYTSTAIGNHEFDFKIEGLEAREKEAHFVFLSANIREKSSGLVPEFATPYIIREVNGIKLGIIGLTTQTAPWSTFPANVVDYDFINYAAALNEFVPMAKNDGAELIIVTGHICFSELEALLPVAKHLGIAVIAGGHCHELRAEKIDNISLIEGGSHLKSYAKVDLLFDIKKDVVLDMTTSVQENTGGLSDPDVQSVVMKWQSQMDTSLSAVIGYANAEIGRSSNEMINMVTDSWLVTLSSADVSLTNNGGIRQNIPSGDITLATMVGLLPFDNTIVEMKLTGKELIDNLHGDIVMGGMTSVGGFSLSDGTPIHNDSIYHVLTTDYLYSQAYYDFQYDDPNPYYTSIHYRQPVIDWIKSLNTSAEDPLNDHLDGATR